MQYTRRVLFTNTKLRVSHVKSFHTTFDWGGGGGRREGRRASKKRNPHSQLCLLLTRASPEKTEVLSVCVFVIYVRLHLSKDERGAHDGESYWTQENTHANSVNSKPASRVYRFRPGTESPRQPFSGVRPLSAPMPSSGLPGRRPYLPYLCLPLDTEAHSRKERSVRPQGDG